MNYLLTMPFINWNPFLLYDSYHCKSLVNNFSLETQQADEIKWLRISKPQHRSSYESHESVNFFYHPLYLVFCRFGLRSIVLYLAKRQTTNNSWCDNYTHVSMLPFFYSNSSKQPAEESLFEVTEAIKVL